MNVLIVTPANVETGRGPVRRLLGVLPHLSLCCEVTVLALNEPDAECRKVFQVSGTRVQVVPFRTLGWFVLNLHDLVRRILDCVFLQKSHLVVLYWEAWDIWRGLSVALSQRQIPFAVMVHGVPFLNAPAQPSTCFYRDAVRQMKLELSCRHTAFSLLRIHQVPNLIRRTSIIVINETIEAYLLNYFGQLRMVRSLPGYAMEHPLVADARERKDRIPYIYMAKLVKEKGVFELPQIMTAIRRLEPRASLTVIGSFESGGDERSFWRAIAEAGLKATIELTGWVSEEEKYRLLRSGEVFLYPSLWSDTFSMSMLEALGCGLPAVCYDVPFVRTVYRTPAVIKVAFQDRIGFAAAAVQLRAEVASGVPCSEATAFARGYSSWSDVAQAEYACYRELLGNT
jgi:glycosyltransferase involved in cell wall biosynthesis